MRTRNARGERNGECICRICVTLGGDVIGSKQIGRLSGPMFVAYGSRRFGLGHQSGTMIGAYESRRFGLGHRSGPMLGAYGSR